MKKNLGFVVLALLVISVFTIAFVIAQDNFTETKQLIDSNISCSELSNEQLEEIGDYYMEQMHPGEAHELMHSMMGGEDSETVKQMHIAMAEYRLADYFITCDNDIIKKGKAVQDKLAVKICGILEFLTEVIYAYNVS